jgi:hypothetical protein
MIGNQQIYSVVIVGAEGTTYTTFEQVPTSQGVCIIQVTADDFLSYTPPAKNEDEPCGEPETFIDTCRPEDDRNPEPVEVCQRRGKARAVE